jgi:large subunit ribosomal protein L17
MILRKTNNEQLKTFFKDWRKTMRHLSSGRKLNRNSSSRIALNRAQATALFRHGRIKTTVTKAKSLQPYVEKLITTARGADLHSRRLVGREIQDQEILRKVMDEIAPKYAGRPGGYTRILKLAMVRRGDSVQEALIELVD